MAERIIGIDLGTTNSVAALLENGEPVVIPTAEGHHLCPSVIAFLPTGERSVGEDARNQLTTNPFRTVVSVKRRMGTRALMTVDGKNFTPEEISAMTLQKLRNDAERYLGEPVSKAVITVPAYFNDAQRKATKNAGLIAGLDVVRIVNEPTAAALAYGMHKRQANTVLVWDVGGGTFDVSILTLGNGVFHVLSTNGDTYLGGDDWDVSLAVNLINKFRDQSGVDLSKDRLALQRFKIAAESAKMDLSSAESAAVNLQFLSAYSDNPEYYESQITREDFESLTANLRERMVNPTMQALHDAKMTAADLDEVILVGGSTRMPALQQMARELLKHEPVVGINPDEVVALGAAVQAGIISGELSDMVLLDVTPLSIGVEMANGGFARVIPRNTTIPTSESRPFTTAKDNQKSVDIHVLQGERELAAQNTSLGRFSLLDIHSAPKGVPRILVTFDIDENGIVHVSAVDQTTGASRQIEVTSSTGLKDEELQAMIAEAERYSKIDKAILEAAELRRKSEELLKKVTAQLDKGTEDIPFQQLASIDKAIIRLRQEITKGNTEGIRTAYDTLHNVSLILK